MNRSSQYLSFVFFILLFSGMRGVTAQPYNYSIEMKKFSNSIDDHFYLKPINYYKEYAHDNGQQERKVSFLWPLCALLEAKMIEGQALGNYKPMQQVFAIVQKYKSNKAPVAGYDSYPTEFGGGTRFYDDNQWIGITAMDMFSRTLDAEWLVVGKEVYTFMMSGFDTVYGGGLYWEEGNKNTKNTCSNGPGIILALQLYKATKDSTYLNAALCLYSWVNHYLKDTVDGLYFDNINVLTGKVDKRKYAYNTGTMMQSAIYFYELTGDEDFLVQAKQLAKSASDYFLRAGKVQDNYWFYAVLMRAYQHLLVHDKNPVYIMQFDRIVANALENDRSGNGLVGKKKELDLVPQGGMLEMLARLAWLQNEKILN